MRRTTGPLILALVIGAAVPAAFERPDREFPAGPRRTAAGPAIERMAGVSRTPGDQPKTAPEQPTNGLATFYGSGFDGQVMASGRRFNMHDPAIAASNHWPLGTRLLVRRIAGSLWDGQLAPDELAAYRARSIVVTVEDRGAFQHELDLSASAFAQLARPDEGVIRVQIEELN